MELRASAQSGPIEDGEANRHTDALLNPYEGNRDQCDQRQSELEAVEASDVHEVTDVEDPGRDVEQHSGEGGEWNVLEQSCRGDQQSECGRRPEPGGLGPAPCRGHGSGPGSTRVHGKGATQSCRDISRADPYEVSAHVDLIVAFVGEGTARRGRLG